MWPPRQFEFAANNARVTCVPAMWTCCVCMETIRPNYRPREPTELPGEQALIMCPMGARPARRRTGVADDASPAAYGGRVGGTMVLAGVCGVVPPGPGVRTDLGCDQCGHFAVSRTAVGDHSRGADPGGSIKAGPAVVAVLFGFFLASTGMADDIQRFLNSIADTINSIQF